MKGQSRNMTIPKSTDNPTKTWPEPNKETLAAIQEARNIAAGKIQAKSYKSVDELFAALETEN